MATAEHREVLSIDQGKFFKAVTAYEEYPRFVEGCTRVKVDRTNPSKARVTYEISMMKDISYTVDIHEDSGAGTVEWTLVDSDTFKVNRGKWILKSAGAGKTDVQYQIEMEFKIKVPSFILNRIVKGRLPAMVKSFELQARKL